MATDPERMLLVRRTLLQYGASAYLRSNFFKDISEKVWNVQVEPKIKAFVANPNFVGYQPQGALARSLEESLNSLANLIIRLQDERA